jgi:hypothetical protein
MKTRIYNILHHNEKFNRRKRNEFPFCLNSMSISSAIVAAQDLQYSPMAFPLVSSSSHGGNNMHESHHELGCNFQDVYLKKLQTTYGQPFLCLNDLKYIQYLSCIGSHCSSNCQKKANQP